ncbi:MAG: hypothetical protein AABP62_10005 [Planctomycetota bacterium]
MHRAIFSLILCAVAASLSVLWLSQVPLGIPGEWTWDRAAAEPDSAWNLIGAAVAAGLYLLAVRTGWKRLCRESRSPIRCVEVGAWLAALVVMACAWLWIVQEAAPLRNRLGKAAFVLYYPSSSGYFTKARYDAPNASAFLAGYEDLMRERDVLHVGTHPPGLFLVFHGLIAACEKSPVLASLLDATQPASFREACDVIATNSLRSKPPLPLLPLDRRALWLATLLVMLSASLVVVPLYGVVRQTHGPATAWLTASLWPAIPAVAVFVPKSDVVYALVGMMIVWTWLGAVKRRSAVLALVAGLLAWCGLMCSLAFLPVFLFAALVSWRGLKFGCASGSEERPLTLSPQSRGEGTGEASTVGGWFGTLPLRCVIAAAAGFAAPTLLLGWLARVNLIAVWWLNYQNHAGFYQQYARTYWKWLLVNPVELSFAAGVPVVLLAAASVVSLGKERRSALAMAAWSMLFVWGTLWLTGKNSGEAARLWIVFLPWLVWLAGPLLADAETKSTQRWLRPAWVLLAVQLAVCLLTVARVSGFHFDS